MVKVEHGGGDEGGVGWSGIVFVRRQRGLELLGVVRRAAAS